MIVDRSETQAESEKNSFRTTKRVEEMAQYRKVEAPMEIDGVGPAPRRTSGTRTSLATTLALKLKAMRQVMEGQNEVGMQQFVEQGKAI